MPCYFPRFLRIRRKDVGKASISRDVGNFSYTTEVRCGRCAGCLKDIQQEWAFRILCESETTLGSIYFIRLSYSPEFLPIAKNGMPTLRKKDLQDFFRTLRNAGYPFRYFACGEYGELGRPHYHVILFCNWSFINRNALYETIEFAWSKQKTKFSKERVLIGSTNCKPFKWQDANYVGKYTVKDITRSYSGIESPFHLQSRKPALGNEYFEKNKKKIRDSHSFLLTDIRGFVHPIPRTFLEKIYSYRELQIHSRDEKVIRDARERLMIDSYGVDYRASNYYFNLAKHERCINRSYERKRNEIFAYSGAGLDYSAW